jgi:hypothetical protein
MIREYVYVITDTYILQLLEGVNEHSIYAHSSVQVINQMPINERASCRELKQSFRIAHTQKSAASLTSCSNSFKVRARGCVDQSQILRDNTLVSCQAQFLESAIATKTNQSPVTLSS